MKLNIDQIKNKVVPILREAGVSRSGLFGSYVRRKERKDSDIDLLVEIPKGTGLFAFVGLKIRLEETLGKKVDLVEYSTLKPRIKNQVIGEQIQII